MKKRIINTFRYRDCDAFAKYLHHQSLQGWHFKEWQFGLVFERGEPADIHYAVEVFPNGAEMDTRPEEDTLEYAEYCEAAGWKLLDSSRKFCISRRTKETSVPIVEPEERFENIRKAEWLLWLSRSIPVFMLTGMQWSQLLSRNFKNWIFSDLMLLTLLFMTFVSIQILSEGIALLLWAHTRRRMLKAGEIPAYGRKRHWDTRMLPFLLYIIFAGFLAYHQEQIYLPILFPAAAILILLLFTGAVIAFWRPSRAGNWIFQIVSSCMILVSFCAITSVLIFSTPDPGNVSEDMKNPPLIQADYRHMKGEISSIYTDHIEGILGKADRFDVTYQKNPFTGGTSDNNMETDSLRYTIYQSRSPWILNRLWKEEMPDPKEHPQERTKAWDALSAVSQERNDHSYKELIRYSDRLLVLYSDEKLEDSQIEIIRQKLCPVQSQE